MGPLQIKLLDSMQMDQSIDRSSMDEDLTHMHKRLNLYPVVDISSCDGLVHIME